MSDLGEKCRSGCRTRDHRSYAECLKDGMPGVNLRTDTSNAWDRELSLYRHARRQGIQPDSTQTRDIQVALEFSDRTGVAYDGSDKAGTLLKAEGLVG